MNCAVAPGLPLSLVPQTAAATVAAVADPGFAAAVDAATALAAPPLPAVAVGTTLPVMRPSDLAPTTALALVAAPLATAVPPSPGRPETRESRAALVGPASAGVMAAPAVATSVGPQAAPPDAPLPTLPIGAESIAVGDTAAVPLADDAPLPRAPVAVQPQGIAPAPVADSPRAATKTPPRDPAETRSSAIAKAVTDDSPPAMLQDAAAAYRAPLQGILVAQAVTEPVATPRPAGESPDANLLPTRPADTPAPTAPLIVQDMVSLAAALAPESRTPSGPAVASVLPASRQRPVGSARHRDHVPSSEPVTTDAAATATPLPAASLVQTATGDPVTTPAAVRTGDVSAPPRDDPAARVAAVPSPEVGAMIVAASVAPPPDHPRPAPSSRQAAVGRDANSTFAVAETPTRPGLSSQPASASPRDAATFDASTPVPERGEGQGKIVAAAGRAVPDVPADAPGTAPFEMPPLPGPTAATTARPDAAIPAAALAHEPLVTARPGQIGHEVGVQIASRLSAGGDQIVVRLVPAELGRIEVHMSFDDQGGLRAVIAADSPVALDMLRRDSADLSRSLSDAGVRSDANSLRFQTDSGGGGSNGQPRSPWLQADARARAARDDPATDFADPTPYRQVRTSGRYDLFA